MTPDHKIAIRTERKKILSTVGQAWEEWDGEWVNDYDRKGDGHYDKTAEGFLDSLSEQKQA